MILPYGQLELDINPTPEMVTYSRSMFEAGTIGSIALPAELEQRQRPNILNEPIAESSWKLVADRLGLDPKTTTFTDLFSIPIPEGSLLTDNMRTRFDAVIENAGHRLLSRVLYLPHNRLLASALHNELGRLNLLHPSEEPGLVDSVESRLPEIVDEPELRVLDLTFGISDWIRRDAAAISKSTGMSVGDVEKSLERGRNLIASAVHRGAFHRYIPTPRSSFASELGYRTIEETPHLVGLDIDTYVDKVEHREERRSRLSASLPFQHNSGALFVALLHDRSEYLDPETREGIVKALRRVIRSNPLEIGFGSDIVSLVEDDELEFRTMIDLLIASRKEDEGFDALRTVFDEIAQI